jgi:amino acid adenylation domain-containing protein
MRNEKHSEQVVIAAGQFLKERKYWLHQLKGKWVKVHFPYDPIKKEESQQQRDATKSLTFTISGKLFTRLTDMSAHSDARLHMILTAGLDLLLYKYTHRDEDTLDIIIGTTINKQEIEGDFINTVLPLRNQLYDNMTFKELLIQVKQTMVEAIENQNYPIEALINDLNLEWHDDSEFPLFDTAILLENIHDRQYLRHIQPNMVFSFLRTGERLEGTLEYHPLLYEESTTRRVISHFTHLLQNAVFNVDALLGEIEILAEEEKKKLLEEFNNTTAAYPRGKNLHQLFEEQVERTPLQIAVIGHGVQDPGHGGEGQRYVQLTYNELNKRANQLAHLVRKKRVGRDTIVGIMVYPSLATAVGILGILKSGGAFLPMDARLPIRRIKTMMDDCQVSLLVTQTDIIEKHSFTQLQQGYQSLEVKPFLTSPRPQIQYFDQIPFPDRSLVNYEKYNQYIGLALVKDCMSIQGTRGCPFKCYYCHKVWPKTHVFRSAENIFEELRIYYDMGVRRFSFIDDIFNLNKKNSTRFFELIIKSGLDLQLFFPNGVRGDILSHDYIDLMVEAGTINVGFALETASPRLQKLIQKNLNLKKFRDNIEYMIEKYPHVIIYLFTMHGFPTETKEEAMMTLNFIKSLKWADFPYLWILHIYPNTDMEKLALENGISPEAIAASLGRAYHELPETLPWEKTFTRWYQTKFLDEYFLDKKRLLQVLPYQLKVLTRDEMVKQYNSILPNEINTFDQLLKSLDVTEDQLNAETYLDEDYMYVPHLNKKLKDFSPLKEPDNDALRVIILDLSLFFSEKRDVFTATIEPPLGPMYLITYLYHQFGGKVRGKIAKSGIDFDNFKDLKELLDEFKPDVIGVRALSYYRDFFHRTLAMIRQWGIDVPIISGGPYATSSYMTILRDRNIDMVVLGEGELTFAEIIQKIMENEKQLPADDVLKEIKGVVFIPGRRDIKQKLDRDIIVMDAPLWEAQTRDDNLPLTAQAGDMAYVIFTSGSTGKPKGTAVEHKGVVNMLTARKEEYNMHPGCTQLQLFSYAFDGFITGFFTPLISGAAVILPTEDEMLDMEKLKKIIEENKVTHFVSIPGFYRKVIENLGSGEVASLRAVTLAGDAIPPQVLELSKQANDGTEIINEYGVTECSVMSTIYRHQDRDQIIKIGHPIRNTRLYILDRVWQLQPIGVAGELCISSIGLARGYLNNPELTAEKFDHDNREVHELHQLTRIGITSNQEFLQGGPGGTVFTKRVPPGRRRQKIYRTGDLARWLPDGNIEHRGRIDHQVKVRGFRIELEEIQRQLAAHPLIKEVVVVVREDEEQNKYLAAYYVEEFGQEPDFPELWPSVAEFFVYDELLYYAMSSDEIRNNSYKAAIDRLVKDKIVVEVGTGADVILARFCLEAGAKKVYAIEMLEDSYKKAREKIKAEGLEEKITLIHGDATKVEIPEKADICLSEIVGPIGGCEGAASILNRARRFLKENGTMIPYKSITKIAAVCLPDEIIKNPGFTKIPGGYVEKIFQSVGYKFDLRICIKNFPKSNIISNSDIFETLDFSGVVVEEDDHPINFTINQDAVLHGFLLWLTLHTIEGEVIDILENRHCWLPVYVPVFYPGIDVNKGDMIKARCIRTLCENNVNPDYTIKGVLIRKNKQLENIEFQYNLPHFETSYKKTPFYRELFKNDSVNYTKNTYGQMINPGELKEYLSRSLPKYMIPSYFVPIEKIPLTGSGKVDRKLLPDPGLPGITGSYEAPVNEMEDKLTAIWGEILGSEKEQISVLANFFDLGGDSLKATNMVAKIHRELNVKLPLAQVFNMPHIRELASFIKDLKKDKFVSAVCTEKKEYYPLSSEQMRLYILKQMNPGDTSYNMTRVLAIEGRLDKEKLEKTFIKLIERHESFRTSLVTLGGIPLQKIHGPDEIEFSAGYEESDEEWAREIIKRFIKPFDFTRPPLLRVFFIKIGDLKHIVMLEMPHITADAVSIQIFVREFMELYEGEELPALKIQYKEYCQWQIRSLQSETFKAQENYWRKEFEKDIFLLNMPYDYENPDFQSIEGDSFHFFIDKEETTALKKLASTTEGTMFMMFLAIYSVFLAKICRQEDIVIATPAAKRTHSDFHPIIGLFADTLLLRNFPEGQKTFTEFFKEVKKRTLEAFENQDYPYIDMIEKLALHRHRNPNRDAIFNVQFQFENVEIPEVEIPGLKLQPYGEGSGTAKLDLLLSGMETRDRIRLIFNYKTKLFKRITIEKFVQYFNRIVSAVLENPEQKLSQMEITPQEKRKEMMDQFNVDLEDE